MNLPAALAFLLLAQDPTPVGWRGDGSGRYPDARPPLSWSRVSKALQGLRFQADRPAPTDGGAPMADGVIREWLVLTPAPGGAKVDKEVLPDEADLSPIENDKIGDSSWKKVRFDTAWMDFNPILSGSGRGIACAITNVFSESGGTFRLHATQLGGLHVVLNGVPIKPGYGRTPLPLQKGWNRLLIKVAPRDPDWACTITLHTRAPAVFDEKGIAWSTALPGYAAGFYGGGSGCGSPVIVKDRIYLLSEPHDLVCLNKADGKVLWVRTNSYFDAATESDRKHPAASEAAEFARSLESINASLKDGPLSAKQIAEKVACENGIGSRMAQVDGVRYKKYETPDVGFSGFTPMTDGTSIYLWLASGVTACYDLDGNRRWIRVDNLPSVEHGFSSSPLLVDGKIIVFMRDLIAIDAKTGAIVWQIPLVKHEGFNPGGFFHGTPVRLTVGGVPAIALANGTIVRASDGRILFTHPVMGTAVVSSPVVDGDRLFQTSTYSMILYLHKLPAAADAPLKMTTQSVSVASPFPKYYMPWHMASPVVHEGLAYLLNNSGVLTVVDVNEAKIVYQKMLDVDQFQTSNEGAARGVGISPAIAGKHLFLFGNNGAMVVLEPGRTFKQVAKNKIESIVSIGHWGERQERFVSNPVFDGDRLYIRGEGHLYALAAGAAGTSQTTAGGPSAPVAKTPASTPIVARPAEPELIPASQFGWRRNGTGHFPRTTPPTHWGEKKNIRWQGEVGLGTSSPVLTGDRVLLTSEPGVLLCLNRADGRLLWKAPLESNPEPHGTKERARPTPVTDGKNVFVSLCNGFVASYTLEGTRTWAKFVDPPVLTYGPSASPVLIGGTLLVEGKRLTALDSSTGKELWKVDGEAHYGTPAVFSLDGTVLAVTSKGTVVRVSDGAVLARNIAQGLGGDQSPTPVVQGGVVYFAYRRCSAVNLSWADGKIRSELLWEQELPGDVISSPVLKDGLLFVLPSSTDYRVMNAATGEVVLDKGVDLSPSLYPSLALAGKYLYLGNDGGDWLVIDASRQYKEVAQNGLPAGSGASPVFGGAHLFLRGGSILYCVGP